VIKEPKENEPFFSESPRGHDLTYILGVGPWIVESFASLFINHFYKSRVYIIIKYISCEL
jgi:predicted flap endonuclease-1-like 5' DNA nuclease